MYQTGMSPYIKGTLFNLVLYDTMEEYRAFVVCVCDIHTVDAAYIISTHRHYYLCTEITPIVYLGMSSASLQCDF